MGKVSYQDIEARLSRLEHMVEWFMNVMQQQRVTKTPFGNAVETKSFFQLYREAEDARIGQAAAEAKRGYAIKTRNGGDEEVGGKVDQGETSADEQAGRDSLAALRESLRAEGLIGGTFAAKRDALEE